MTPLWALAVIGLGSLLIAGLIARSARRGQSAKRQGNPGRSAFGERLTPRRRRAREAPDELTETLEALLEGRYVEYLERRGRRVPVWAWTNLLAHGTEDALRRAARARQRPFWDVNVWRRARSYLAGEVLDAADQAGSLALVQLQVLIPLELDLVAWVPSRWWSCAGEWATRVLAALDEYAAMSKSRGSLPRKPGRGPLRQE